MLADACEFAAVAALAVQQPLVDDSFAGLASCFAPSLNPEQSLALCTLNQARVTPISLHFNDKSSEL